MMGFINCHMKIDPSLLKKQTVDDTPKPPPKQKENTTTTTDHGVTPSPPQPEAQVEMISKKIRSNGREFTIEFPSTHRLVHKDHLTRWYNDSRTLQRARSKMQSIQYSTSSTFSQALWSIALTSAPALALSAAQHLFPLLLFAYFYDAGLMNNLEHAKYAQAFPSDNTLRKHNLLQATRDTMLLGNSLRNKKIYLACDKGNKKGVGHFVKVLATLNDLGIVVPELLDIDASGGTSSECAAAIRASMNKLKLNDEDNTHLLYGQATDSGGGGTLESFHDRLKALGLCAADDLYLIAPCCVHALQIQLKNAVCKTFGEGALDRVNAMQLLHSVYRLQESLDMDEWRYILLKASQWVSNYTPQDEDDLVEENNKKKTAQEKHEDAFIREYNKVYKFHSKFNKKAIDVAAKITGTLLAKMQQPILTRWWTVGSASSYTFDYYLHIFHACQTVINMYKADSTPNIIASNLFAMMKDQETFIDMTLIRCFHKGHINPHFDWLQSADDASGALGFVSHHILIRFFLMNRDLGHILTRRSFPDYQEAVRLWKGVDDSPNARTERSRHLTKLSLFVKTARTSLMKHFQRWLNHSLMPAALLSEAPTAKVVAACMLGKSMPTFESVPAVRDETRLSGKIMFQSTVHKQAIALNLLYQFIKQQLESIADDGTYTPESLVAANCVHDDNFDLRLKDYQSDYGSLRWHMQSTYFPLPCHTQFVESFVKDAANVAQTDRSEQHRSWCAIVRASTPLTRSKEMANVNRITGILTNAYQRSDPHDRWRREQGPAYEYEARLATMSCALSSDGHFKTERVDAKKANVDDKGPKHKKPNMAQQTKKQYRTSAVTGLIPYGKLVKARNMQDLEVELLFRGVPDDAIPASVSDRKDMLKQLEFERLMSDCGMSEQDAIGHKAFKKQSSAPFRLTDA